MKALSLHIGINKYDNEKYGVTIPELFCCHNDVNDLEAIALSKNFITTKLLDEQASYYNVTKALNKFSEQLENGDIFWLTYSGHGTQLPDLTSDESDQKDEAFVLYDSVFLDDEFNSYLAKFKEGVKILIVADCCHSGTVQRGKKVARFVPESVWVNYPLRKAVVKSEIKASGILLSACQDKEVAYENEKNGLFTSVLKTLLTTSESRLTPKKLTDLISVKLKGKQKPNYSVFGLNTNTFTRLSLTKFLDNVQEKNTTVYQNTTTSGTINTQVQQSINNELNSLQTTSTNEIDALDIATITNMLTQLNNLASATNSLMTTTQSMINKIKLTQV